MTVKSQYVYAADLKIGDKRRVGNSQVIVTIESKTLRRGKIVTQGDVFTFVDEPDSIIPIERQS